QRLAAASGEQRAGSDYAATRPPKPLFPNNFAGITATVPQPGPFCSSRRGLSNGAGCTLAASP
ncbi:hypothetical protein MGN70_004019, partial [Eutypa lata]